MTSRGRDVDSPDRPELEHFGRCPACDRLFDMRDLGEVMARIHDQEIKLTELSGQMPSV
jgi:hypothetical protein